MIKTWCNCKEWERGFQFINALDVICKECNYYIEVHVESIKEKKFMDGLYKIQNRE